MDEQQAPIVPVALRPPGAGKGTQSGMLAGRLRVPRISIGSVLRSYARDKGEAGSRLNSTMVLGNLAPDSLVLALLATRISEPDCAQGLILDGFPRTLRQAEFLERGLLKPPLHSTPERGSLIVLYPRVQDRTIVGRVSGRRICSRCGATCHLESQPPRMNGECDFDGSAITIREDDRKATVLKRHATLRTANRADPQPLRRKGKPFGNRW
jgi:adenylate kinase